MKTIIERGASWTLDETKLLLSLWGQDLIQRQATCQKRTKEVYEKISEKFNSSGFERTPDQVRTRVFNMIAEYRRILRDPTPERMKKCIFFDALHRIYQAKHMDDVQSALDDYEPESPPYIRAGRGDDSVSDSETIDETSNNNDRATADAVPYATTTHSKKSHANTTTSESVNDSINIKNDNSIAAPGGNKQAGGHEKDGTGTNQANKKIKLDSPKPGSSQASMEAVEATPISKQKGSSSASSTSSAASLVNNSSNATSSAATNNISGSRHQSLLLPQTPPVSTPINKLQQSSGNNSTQAYINVSSSLKNVMGATRLVGPNGSETLNLNGTPTANRLPTTAAITSHQFYQAPVNTFDVTSSALLIDRMFSHLSRESENMREWIALEKDRISLERARRAQETERDSRRERVLIDTLMKFQDQWISFITKLTPGLIEKHADQMPTLNIPPREVIHETESQGIPKLATQSSQVTVGANTSTTSNSTMTTTTTNNTSSSPSINTSTSSGDIL